MLDGILQRKDKKFIFLLSKKVKEMAKFLFTVLPALGHLSPTIPVAKELQRRGNEIAYASGHIFEDLLRGEGFLSYSLGAKLELKELEKFYPKLGKLKGTKRQIYTFKEIIIPSTPDIVRELQDIISEFQPDVMVVDSVTYAGAIAAQIANIPWATTSVCPGGLPGKHAHLYGFGLPKAKNIITKLIYRISRWRLTLLACYSFDRQINTIREKFNLPPLKFAIITSTLSPYLYLAFTTLDFEYPRRKWPNQVHFVGASLWDKPSDFKLPDWFNTLPKDKPIVYITLGTFQGFFYTYFFEIAYEALSGLDMQVIMTVGKDVDITTLPTPPKNFIIEQYIPNTELLPKVSCMVHHGGFNSTIAPIVYGVPVVVVPFDGDQLENAQRCVEAGIGVRLNYKKLTPKKLKEAVLHVLSEPRFKENVLQLKEKFAQHNGDKEAAELLIKLI